MNKKIINPTKAEALNIISNQIKKNKFIVPKFFFLKKGIIKKNFNPVINKLQKTFNTNKIIIRSSSLNEDSLSLINAGKYNSYICSLKDIKIIKIKTFKLLKELKSNNDQVIFQEYIDDVSYAGVCFTKEINSSAPYYCISIDYSGKTNVVTSGSFSNDIRTFFVYKYKKKYYHNFNKIISVFQELEKIFKSQCLDIEFAVKDKLIYIFQCRSIELKDYRISKSVIQNEINKIEKKIKKNQCRKKNLYGSSTFFSKMSDWNPVEILGEKSSQLSSSLYSELITKNVWSEQRKNYCYKHVKNYELMLDFAGTPFIDLRTDLNSFLIKKMPAYINKKLISFYLKKIENNPLLHDKIEFDVIKSCYDFQNKDLGNYFRPEEKKIISKHLAAFTNHIVNNEGLIKKDIDKIKILKKNYKSISSQKINEIKKNQFIN